MSRKNLDNVPNFLKILRRNAVFGTNASARISVVEYGGISHEKRCIGHWEIADPLRSEESSFAETVLLDHILEKPYIAARIAMIAIVIRSSMRVKFHPGIA